MDMDLNSKVFSDMQTGKPYKRYLKAILGKVFVYVLDPFSGRPEGRIVEGDPNTHREDCFIEIWSEKEDVFFKRRNKRLLERGFIIPYKKELEVKPQSVNVIEEEEWDKILHSKYIAFQHKINSFTSVAPLFSLINRAKEIDASEKYIAYMQNKLSELQAKEYETPETEEEE